MRTGQRIATLAALVALILVGSACTPGLAPVDQSPVGGSGSVGPTGTDGPGATAAPSGPADIPSPAASLRVATAPTQTFAVGVRQLDLSRGTDRPLRTVIWYPAAGAAGGSQATPAAGVYPLVLFSHGLTATPEAYQRITTRIAAAGFIVAAPAYPFTSGVTTRYNPADLINQPADGTAVITGVLALNSTPGDPLAGHVDPNRIAAAGHSGGAYTTVGMLAGGRDDRIGAAIVIAGGSLGGSFRGPAAPVLFVHGDKDPIVTYSIGRSTYGMVPWPKAFLTVTGGDHSSYLFASGTAATAVSTSMLDFLRWALYGDGSARSRLAGTAAVAGATTFETSL